MTLFGNQPLNNVLGHIRGVESPQLRELCLNFVTMVIERLQPFDCSDLPIM